MPKVYVEIETATTKSSLDSYERECISSHVSSVDKTTRTVALYAEIGAELNVQCVLSKIIELAELECLEFLRSLKRKFPRGVPPRNALVNASTYSPGVSNLFSMISDLLSYRTPHDARRGILLNSLDARTYEGEGVELRLELHDLLRARTICGAHLVKKHLVLAPDSISRGGEHKTTVLYKPKIDDNCDDSRSLRVNIVQYAPHV